MVLGILGWRQGLRRVAGRILSNEGRVLDHQVPPFNQGSSRIICCPSRERRRKRSRQSEQNLGSTPSYWLPYLRGHFRGSYLRCQSTRRISCRSRLSTCPRVASVFMGASVSERLCKSVGRERRIPGLLTHSSIRMLSTLPSEETSPTPG